jgi:Bacterial PH domain
MLASQNMGAVMLGTLDNPPIIIEQDKAKISAGIVCSTALFLMVALLQWNGASRSIEWGYVLVAIFGTLTLGLAVQLFRPGRLVIDRNGVSCRLLLNTTRYPWEDIASFATYSRNAFSRVPAILLAESSKLYPLSRRLTGGLSPLGGLWELSTPEIVDILNEARKRWGTQSP